MSWLITGLNCSVESCQRIPDRPAIRLHLLPGESGGKGRRRQAAQPGPNLEMIIMQTKQQKSNVVRLAIAQALSMTSMNVNIINTALVGYLLAPAPWLATLPLSLQFVSVMMITLPASLLMARIGRRPVFIAGVLISCISSLLLRDPALSLSPIRKDAKLAKIQKIQRMPLKNDSDSTLS